MTTLLAGTCVSLLAILVYVLRHCKTLTGNLVYARGTAADYKRMIGAMETRLGSLGCNVKQSDSKSRLILNRLCQLRTEFVLARAKFTFACSIEPNLSKAWDQLEVGQQRQYTERARGYLEDKFGSIVG